MSVYTIRNLRQQATDDHDDVQAERDGVTVTSSSSPISTPTTTAPPPPLASSPAVDSPTQTTPTSSPPPSVVSTALLGFVRSDVTIFLYFFLILLLYFGGSANPLQWLGRLHILVVDLDSPPSPSVIPPTMGQILEGVIAGLTGDHLTFEVHTTADYASTADAVNAAYAAPTGSEYWASILVQANATAQWQADVQTALSGGMVSAPAQSNALFLVETARNSFLYGNYILSQINPILGQSSGIFQGVANQHLLTRLPTCTNVSQCVAAFLAQPPLVQSYLLSPAMSTEVDLAPAQPFVGTVATTLGLVIQWIFCAAVVGTTIGNSARLVSAMSIWKVVAIRIANTFLMTLALSGLFAGMVAWWAEGAYDGSTIGVYWMFGWLYMSTFCMFNIIFALNLGVFADLTGVLFLFLNVVSSTSQLPVQLQERFYTIGVGLPLYNAIVGSRRLLMNGRQEGIGTNVGVLLAWLFGCSLFNLAVDARRMHLLKMKQGGQQAGQSSPTTPSPSH